MSSVPAEPFRVTPADLPAWLAGTWSVERDINDGQGTFTGTARFAAQPDGTVRWAEEGTLRLGDFTGPATRVLFLHPAAPWDVHFDDGRLFHPLDLSGGGFAAEHPCGPDLYRGHYEPLTDDELLVRWHVTGPGREDDIVSRYRRTR